MCVIQERREVARCQLAMTDNKEIKEDEEGIKERTMTKQLKQEVEARIKKIGPVGAYEVLRWIDEATLAERARKEKLKCSEHGQVKAQPACPHCLKLILKTNENIS